MIKQIHAILKDKECKDNIKSLSYSALFILIYLGTFIYGMAWLNHEFDLDKAIAYRIHNAEERLNNNIDNRMREVLMPSAFKGMTRKEKDALSNTR